MQASANELQAIIDEAWKTQNSKLLLKTNLDSNNSLSHQGSYFLSLS